MKKFLAVEVEGLSGLLKELDQYEAAIIKEVDAELKASAYKIARDAKRNAPDKTGRLKNSISVEEEPLSHTVVAQTFYAPYVEFGTGGLVDVPAGLEEYAWQFHKGGNVNLPAQPFLFPAYAAERKLLINRIKELLKNPKK